MQTKKIYPENVVQRKLKLCLENLGFIVIKNISVSQRGWPDMTAHGFGMTIFFECKSTGEIPEPHQLMMLKRLSDHGFGAYIIDHPDEIKAVESMIKDALHRLKQQYIKN